MTLPCQNNKYLKKTLKIIGLYIIGLFFMVLFFYIDNSQDLTDFLQKADRYRTDWGFGLYAIIGLIKQILLISGLTIIFVLTIMLLRQIIKKTTQ